MVLVVRASALQSIDLDFVPLSSHTKNLNMIMTSSQLGAQHENDGLEKEPLSLLVVSLEKALNEIPRSL